MFVLDPSGWIVADGSTKALAAANWWSIAEVTFTAAWASPRWPRVPGLGAQATTPWSG